MGFFPVLMTTDLSSSFRTLAISRILHCYRRLLVLEDTHYSRCCEGDVSIRSTLPFFFQRQKTNIWKTETIAIE